ncbi:ABC transporter permease [Kutzneria viridogrisea]|uniref:Transport permease protein n=1 Tax=Kutzneria viridogrisea TaxID=47990 RepID=A0ABR6BLC6_9PSEU|nr:lipooligosaccharide transport system permease protein [Kutzneria viridogrisea]
MSIDLLAPPRAGSTGRAVGALRAIQLVVEGHWAWYRRNWRASALSSFLMPVLLLVAMGFGLGTQVRPGPATLGQPYVVYLAPAVLVAALVQTAAGESTYPVLSAFKWAKTYWAVISTPITVSQVFAGQLVWIALRLLAAGVAFLAVAACLGALTGPGVLLALPAALLAAMAFGAWIVALAASVTNEGTAFSAVFRFVVLPMTLFAGTYYPIDRLPEWARPVAWLTPMAHGNALARGAAFGNLDWLAAGGHVAYLLAMLVAGLLVAHWRFRVRLRV